MKKKTFWGKETFKGETVKEHLVRHYFSETDKYSKQKAK